MKSDKDKDVNDDSEKPTELTSSCWMKLLRISSMLVILPKKMIQMKFVAQKSFKVCLVTSKVTLKRLKKSWNKRTDKELLMNISVQSKEDLNLNMI